MFRLSLVPVHRVSFPAALLTLLLLHGGSMAKGQTQTTPVTGSAPPTTRGSVSRSALEFDQDDKKLLSAYKLTPDKLDKFEITTRKLQDSAKRDPAMRAQFEAVGSASKGRSLADAISRIESSSPAVNALFRECNTTARDYVLTSFALVTAAMGSVESAPPSYVPTENIAFFRANRARIETDFRSFQSR